LRAGWWTGLISLNATLANLTPVLILPGCHG
jgi:membrane-associated protease RseP (regulator of RpoE activity)